MAFLISGIAPSVSLVRLHWPLPQVCEQAFRNIGIYYL